MLVKFFGSGYWLPLMLAVMCMGCRKKIISEQDQGEQSVAETHLLFPVIKKINDAFGGYYVALPPQYFETKDSFPLLIFLHGLGQMGDGNSQLHYILNDGIGKLIKEKKFPVSFRVNGEDRSFIVVSPQSSREPTVDEVMEFIDYIRGSFRTDKHHIYLSGLSLGARVVTLVAARHPDIFAAIVPIAGVAINSGMKERCRNIATSNLPVWEFHNADDPMANVADARRFIDFIRDFNPAIQPRFTVFNVYGHDAWTTALDPAHREDGMNIYEWMLRYSR
jgi:predicted peptidase